MMTDNLLFQGEFLLRLITAGICGAFIGYERKNRLKEAGVRTHLLVALGAALMMIISKYGFSDVVNQNGITLDPSRVAAQIVSGIGFLGAGMIFIRKQAVSGLTTAAGIWATAGVGMAIGAKLYFLGIASTVIIILAQIFLHRNFKWLHLPVGEQINIVFNDDHDAISYVQKVFYEKHIEIITIKAERNDDGYIEVEIFAKMPQRYDIADLMNLFKNNPHIKSIEY